jgi:hypothetical protein
LIHFSSLVINNTNQLPPMTGVTSIQWPYEFGFTVQVNRPGSTVADANASWKLQWVARP